VNNVGVKRKQYRFAMFCSCFFFCVFVTLCDNYLVAAVYGSAQEF